MRKVVLVNQSTGYLMIDIANAYATVCDDVVLLAGSIKIIERKLDTKITVDPIISYDRTSSLKRLLTWVIGTIQIFIKLLFKYRKYEIVYVTNPPMCYLLSLLMRQPFSIIVYDIYPEALKSIGIREQNWIYKWWGNRNRILFKRADQIVTLSNGMKQQLSRYVDATKIKVIPNWAASEDFHPINKAENRFIKQQHLQDKFIILYSGNIGYTHNVEYLIEVAKLLKNDKDICFLIIGEGKKKAFLQTKVAEYGLNSVLFMTWQDKEVLPYSLGSADVAVVTLNDDTALVSVPSKTYNLLAVGAPLLCIAPKHSELSSLIQKYENGRCFDKEEVHDIADYILFLKSHPKERQILSCHSLEASKDFTFKNAQEYV